MYDVLDIYDFLSLHHRLSRVVLALLGELCEPSSHAVLPDDP